MRNLYITIMTVAFVLGFSSIASANHFNDVGKGLWFYQAVEDLTNQNIISGYKDGSYKPYEEITRAQAAKILYGALGEKENTNYLPKYKDLPTNHWAYKYIQALTAKGIFSDANSFDPEGKLTRAQMAKILVEGFNLENTSLKTFKDVKSTDWHAQYVNKLYTSKITLGVTDTQFNPYGVVNRSQMASFINRALKYQKNGEVLVQPNPNPTTEEMDLSMYETQLMKDTIKRILN